MAFLPSKAAQDRMVIAPNLEIRRGVSTAPDVAGRECFWTSTRVLTDVSHGPFPAVLDGQDANIHDCENSHIVLTNIQQLASRADRWLSAFPDDFFDLILVAEGHHNVARSWERVFERFPNAKVVSLTATPFRGDGREIASERVYAYPFRSACRARGDLLHLSRGARAGTPDGTLLRRSFYSGPRNGSAVE